MARTVLDSFALLAFLREEPGHDLVRQLLKHASEHDQPLLMTEVNYAEVKYITVRKDGRKRWERIAAELVILPIEFEPVSRRLADVAADFKARYTISLADAFAAALAKERHAELVTGDKEFIPLQDLIKIQWLPRRSS